MQNPREVPLLTAEEKDKLLNTIVKESEDEEDDDFYGVKD
jgi:hypothetical protein